MNWLEKNWPNHVPVLGKKIVMVAQARRKWERAAMSQQISDAWRKAEQRAQEWLGVMTGWWQDSWSCHCYLGTEDMWCSTVFTSYSECIEYPCSGNIMTFLPDTRHDMTFLPDMRRCYHCQSCQVWERKHSPQRWKGSDHVGFVELDCGQVSFYTSL